MSRVFVIGMITRPCGVSLERYPFPTVNQKGLRWHNWNHLAGLDHLDARCQKRNRLARRLSGAMFSIRLVNDCLIHAAYDAATRMHQLEEHALWRVHYNPFRPRRLSNSFSSEEITRGREGIEGLGRHSGTICRMKSRCEGP